MSDLEATDNGIEESGFIPAGAKKSKLSKFIVVAVLLVLAAGGYFAYQSLKPQESSYLTQPVTKGSLVKSVEATGTVVPMREADLNFKSDTMLKSISIDAGTTVAEGQVLALQDDVDFRSAVEQAGSSFQQTKYRQEQSSMSLEKAKRTYAQQTALYESGAISQSDYQTAKDDQRTAEINMELAKAQTRAAQSDLASAQENLDNAKLKAPFAGIITVVNGVVGTSTSGSAFAHLISKDLKIEAMVNEADIGSVKVGQSVEFTVTTYPDKTFKGTVQRITQQASTTSSVQQYEVDITVDNSDNLLLSGMSVTANIIVARRSDAVLVPMLALTYAQTYIQENPSAMAGTSQTLNRGSNNSTSGSFSRNPNRANGSSTGMANKRGSWGQRFNRSATTGASQSSTTPTSKRRFAVVLVDDQPVVLIVRIGIDDSQNAEVLSGLSGGEKVVIGKYSETTSGTNSDTNSKGNSGSNDRSRNQPGMGRGFGEGMGGPHID